MTLQVLQIEDEPSIAYVGPDFKLGKLPAVVYFSLSKEDSLGLDPYNQPVQFLQGKGTRVFSFTLPGHGEGFDNKQGMQFWADALAKNPKFFSDFIEECSQVIDRLILKEIIDPENLSVAGLSRGSFIAVHLAAINPNIKTILGFAPLTFLDHLHEFHPEFDYKPYNLNGLIDKLIGKALRFYIGNHDTRVGTAKTFNFIKELSDKSYVSGIRSPQVELIITPSVGQHGHGTLPHTFQDGITWLLSKL